MSNIKPSQKINGCRCFMATENQHMLSKCKTQMQNNLNGACFKALRMVVSLTACIYIPLNTIHSINT